MNGLISTACCEETCTIFFNHLVLEKIFHHLEYVDLKTIRQVCNLWNLVSSPILNVRSVVVLNESSELSVYRRRMQLIYSTAQCVPHLRISDFILTFEDVENLNLLWKQELFVQCLVSLEIDFTPSQVKQITTDLISGQTFVSLKKLKIRVLKFYPDSDEDEEEDELGMILAKENYDICVLEEIPHTKFPRLKSFSYVYFSFDWSEFTSPREFKMLFKQFHFLEEIILTGASSRDLTEIFNLIQISKDSHKKQCKIKCLEIFSQDLLTKQHLEQIMHLDLPLSTLRLEIGTKFEESDLESLLHHYRYSLEEIQFRKYPPTVSLYQFNPQQIQSPLFRHDDYSILTQLNITDGFLPSLDFLCSLPNLTTLRISNRNPSKLSETEMIRNTTLYYFPHQGLQSLTVEENVSTSCSKNISFLFPNLLHLQLRMDDAMLRIVFENMTQLKSLSIIAKISDEYEIDGVKVTCTDKGFTGIPLRYMEWGGANVTKYRLFPYIGDLKDLETLKIESWSSYGHGITDSTVFYALLELKKLKKVHLIRTLVSRDGIDALRAIGVTTTTAKSS